MRDKYVVVADAPW